MDFFKDAALCEIIDDELDFVEALSVGFAIPSRAEFYTYFCGRCPIYRSMEPFFNMTSLKVTVYLFEVAVYWFEVAI